MDEQPYEWPQPNHALAAANRARWNATTCAGCGAPGLVDDQDELCAECEEWRCIWLDEQADTDEARSQ